MGTMPSERVFEVRGRRVRVKDSLRSYLSIAEMLSDERLEAEDRAALLLPMAVVNPAGFVEAFGLESFAALAEVLWEAFGIDLLNEHPGEHGEKVMDWREDHERIVATVRAAYTLSYEELLDLPYKEAATLVGMAPDGTPMGQALYYRTAEMPKHVKADKEASKAYRKLREHYRLKGGEQGTDAANRAATSEFDALERRFGR